MNEAPPAPPASDLIERISTYGKQVQNELRQVLTQLPGEQRVRPQTLAKRLGLNKSLTSRLLIALDNADPLAAAQALPGPLPLRAFLDAAGSRGVPEEAVTRARHAVDGFEMFLEEHFEERGEMDVLLGSALHDVRVKAESASKQALFRGSVGLTGVMCEATLSTFMVHPSAEDGRRCDMALLGGITGLRRLRPDVVVEHTVHRLGAETREARGRDPDGPLVGAMCRPRDLPLEVTEEAECVTYRLLGDGIGRRSAVSFIVRDFWRSAFSRFAEPGGPERRFFGGTISQQPARRLVLDVFVHQGVWNNPRPELFIYNLACHGPVRSGDPKQSKRRMDLAESVKLLGTGTACARHPDLPGYVEAINETAEQHGWRAREFRVHRCEMVYPPFGCQVSIGFDLNAAE